MVRCWPLPPRFWKLSASWLSWDPHPVIPITVPGPEGSQGLEHVDCREGLHYSSEHAACLRYRFWNQHTKIRVEDKITQPTCDLTSHDSDTASRKGDTTVWMVSIRVCFVPNLQTDPAILVCVYVERCPCATCHIWLPQNRRVLPNPRHRPPLSLSRIDQSKWTNPETSSEHQGSRNPEYPEIQHHKCFQLLTISDFDEKLNLLVIYKRHI